jgi:hypothetical protein
MPPGHKLRSQKLSAAAGAEQNLHPVIVFYTQIQNRFAASKKSQIQD